MSELSLFYLEEKTKNYQIALTLPEDGEFLLNQNLIKSLKATNGISLVSDDSSVTISSNIFSVGLGLKLENGKVELLNISSSSDNKGALLFNGVEKNAGYFYGGIIVPDSNIRLNYDGNFHSSSLFEGDVRVVNQDRQIITAVGSGIQGGSNLSQDVNLSLDDTVIRTSVEGTTPQSIDGDLNISGNLNVLTINGEDASSLGIEYVSGSGISISPEYIISVDSTVLTTSHAAADVTTTKISNWDSAYSHVESTGSSHTWLNQSVTTTANVTFNSINGIQISWG